MRAQLRAIEARVDAIDDVVYTVTNPNLYLRFMVWDCNIRDVTLGCCEVEPGTAHAVIRYEDASGYTRVVKGKAHIEAQGGARTPCDIQTAMAVLSRIEASEGLSAEVFFDGQLDLETDFKLHLRLQRYGLVIQDVAQGNNPLTVIDLFM